jgi:hypothetical protein
MLISPPGAEMAKSLRTMATISPINVVDPTAALKFLVTSRPSLRRLTRTLSSKKSSMAPFKMTSTKVLHFPRKKAPIPAPSVVASRRRKFSRRIK